MKHVVVARLVATAVLGLVLAGCTGNTSTPPEATDTPSKTQPVPGSLQTFYDQQISWSDCDDFQCGTFNVPLDYAHPSQGTLTLNVVRRPANDGSDRIGQLLVNPGGPGVSGTDFVRQASYFLDDSILDKYDVVGWDPRGVGTGDSAVHCLTDQQTDQYLAADPTPDNATEVAQLLVMQRNFTKACKANSGSLLPHIGTENSARDMDILRAALGEGRTDYLGFSYGTELGATYANLFPERVGRMVLDGAVDPTLTSTQIALGQVRGFQRATDAFIQDCLARDGCPLGPSASSAEHQIFDLLNQVDAKPLTTDSGRPLTESLATTGMLAAMYDQANGWPALRIALSQAFQGNGTALLALADSYSERNSDGTYSSNVNAAFPAISCTDRPDSASAVEVTRALPQFEHISPVFGRNFAWSETACKNWPVSHGAFPQKLTAKGASPILVIGTTRDPATPYEWAVGLAKQLDSGVLLTRNGDGHTAYHSGNDCIDQTVNDYLLNDTVPPNGKVC
jgi:pimeloyl-ACP methyl ester carboxylesterase